ncbi:MAG: MFS transporter [Bacteroidales bacterium]
MMQKIKISGSPSLGLWGATLGFFFGMAAVSLFGPTAHKFEAVMDLSPTMVGLLVAIPSLSGSLLRIPFGAWVDTTGGKKPFAILMILSIIGVAGLMWLVNTHYPAHMTGFYPLVLFFGLLAGCGVATFSVGISQSSYWFPQKQQGFATGTFGGVGTLAPGLFALLLPIAITSYGLGISYIAWTIFLIIGTALYFLMGKNAPFFQYKKAGMPIADSKLAAQQKGEELFPTGSIKQSLIESAKIPATWILTALYFASFGGFLALTEWYPNFWRQFYNLKPIEAGVLTAVFSMLSAVIRILAGPLSDKVGGKRLCLYSMVLLMVSAFGMGLSTNFGLSLTFTILIAIAMGVNDTAVFKMVPKFIPKAVGGASGWIGGIGAFGGFIVPPIMGVIAGKYGKMGYAWGFEVFVLLAVINILIIWFGMRRRPTAEPVSGNTPGNKQ